MDVVPFLVKKIKRHALARLGGGRGIRTLEAVSDLAVFKTAAFNHSAIPPM